MGVGEDSEGAQYDGNGCCGFIRAFRARLAYDRGGKARFLVSKVGLDIEDEAIAHVSLLKALKRLINLGQWKELDLRRNVVLRAKVNHFLSLTG